MKENVIMEMTMNFAINAVKFSRKLKELKEFEIRGQLLRSATSIGANVFEAQAAESRADFVHKLKIAQKEAQETKFWLLLCKRSEYLPTSSTLINDLDSILKVLTKIIFTTRSS